MDFEGNRDRPPTLLGVMVEEALDQYVVEEVFRSCCDRNRARAMWQPLPECLHALLNRAVQEERVLISWSRHDRDLILKACPELQTPLEAVWRNAIRTARAWRYRIQPDMTGPHTLAAYMHRLAWEVPEEVGTGTPGAHLRALRTALSRPSRQWSSLTASQKRRWRAVLRHNRHDLHGMKRVLIRMAADLEEHTAS